VAFIVEDGTGIEDSNAYVNSEYVENYLLSERLDQFKALSDEDKEAAIIAGTQLVDISYEYIGNRASLEQGLNWPRVDAEYQGFVIEGVPSAVKKATCEAVWLAMTMEDGLYSNEADKEVASERIEGAVAISYVNPKDRAKETATRFEILDRVLCGLYNTGEQQGGPSVGSAPVIRV
jgi:hypothetical protein